MTVVGWLCLIAASLLLVPSLVFFVECFASLFFRRRTSEARPEDVTVVVLVPAHDESAGIASTVEGVLQQLAPKDRVVVVADNCTDDTATVARAAGAEVIERNEPELRGKGYALAFGMESLEAAPPDLVIIVDADCRLTPRSIDALVARATQTGCPVQADYIMRSPDRSPLSMISALAMLVRNRVRPRGLSTLGMPTQLTGTGMAFPWAVMKAAPALGANLVEDLALGIELALLGYEPQLSAEAGVRSDLPTGARAAMTQRRRWEHGQLGTLAEYGPRLFRAGIAKGRLGLLALGCDLIVPPLALLVGLQLVLLAVSAVVLLLGGPSAGAWVAVAGLVLVALGVGIGWARYGRSEIPGRYLLATPFYVLWKVPLYVALAVGRRERTWRRTER